jgi:ABC-type transporter Mla subunit MlaD
LNTTSTSEKQVLEKAFAVVEDLIAQVNNVTGLQVGTFAESADLSEFISGKIDDADSLLEKIRAYVNQYIDTASENIREYTPYIEKTSVVTDIVDNVSDDLQQLAVILNKTKEADFKSSLAIGTVFFFCLFLFLPLPGSHSRYRH